jgi:excisionase family DNA binding protein
MAELLTTAEVAERLRVGVSTVNRYARQGLLTAVKLPGGARRYRADDIDRLLEPEPVEALG